MIIYTSSGKNLGNQIKTIRLKYGISQSTLAEISGIHVDTISRWERGLNIPSIDIAIKVLTYIAKISNEEVSLSIKSRK